ncbi:tail fiber domain-containing protein [Kosakonia quasisacchari]|uniref:Tail fiber domain-containing protein n=1 Tax=Kosakonia quasisacchari TaxID=2529380 RepID=A0A4R0GJI2_9ENTR|nr:tail fiber domain-containing protein [Kosakonia quasisacchari]TCB97386.1 tail fiber domain-containing protein [Kosakonia quasisacchari]
MSLGTVSLTPNSDQVVGLSTLFTAELAANDYMVVVVGGIPYSLPVKSVNSDTSLTLVTKYTAPAQSGAAWYAIPRVAMSLISAAVVAQSTEALRGLNYDKQNWQQLFTGSGTITVKLPDQSTYTGPSWNYILTQLNNKADTSSLGNSATRNVGTTSGSVAAGDDSRFGTVAGKSGGEITSSVSVVGSTTCTAKTTSDPTTGVLVAGGAARSAYQVNGVERVVAGLQAKYSWGQATSYAELSVAVFSSTGAAAGASFIFNGNGSATASGSWISNSDIRLKTAVKRIEDPLDKMEKIRGVTWKRLDGIAPGIGFIAQEVQEVFPDHVFVTGDRTLQDGTLVENVLSPDTSGVAAALHHEAILALKKQIVDLQEVVNQLKQGS